MGGRGGLGWWDVSVGGLWWEVLGGRFGGEERGGGARWEWGGVGRVGGGGARWEVGGRGGLGWRSKVRWEVLGGRS